MDKRLFSTSALHYFHIFDVPFLPDQLCRIVRWGGGETSSPQMDLRLGGLKLGTSGSWGVMRELEDAQRTIGSRKVLGCDRVWRGGVVFGWWAANRFDWDDWEMMWILLCCH